jgi:hypothetical protein
VNSNFNDLEAPPASERLPIRPELMSLGGASSSPFQIVELPKRIRSSAAFAAGQSSMI